MITVKEKIPTTEEEFNSVKENDRLTLSEQLHGRKGRLSKQYKNKSDSLTEEFQIRSEEF